MTRYKICYHYLDYESNSYVEAEMSGKDLNALWKEYCGPLFDSHDLAKFGPRSITKIEQIDN